MHTAHSHNKKVNQMEQISTLINPKLTQINFI